MKKLFRILFCFLLFCFSIIPIQAQDNTVWIKDNAGILSSEEAEKLETRINTLADTYDVGIYLYTVNSRDTDSIESYAEEVYKAEEKNAITFSGPSPLIQALCVATGLVLSYAGERK